MDLGVVPPTKGFIGAEHMQSHQTQTAKRRRNARSVLRQFKAIQQKEKHGVPDRAAMAKKTGRQLERPVLQAFTDAGLDMDNESDWRLLVFILAVALYSPKGPGRPKHWTKKKINIVKADIAEIRANNPALSDLECCTLLAKRNGSNPMYRVAPATLLRRLYPEQKV